MQLTLFRYNESRLGIDGDLHINGHHFCDTVEHPLKRLPKGNYTFTHRNHPFLRGDGPMLARNGEIIVGTNALPGLVKGSSIVFNRLYDQLKKAVARGQTITLTIR